MAVPVSTTDRQLAACVCLATQDQIVAVNTLPAQSYCAHSAAFSNIRNVGRAPVASGEFWTSSRICTNGFPYF